MPLAIAVLEDDVRRRLEMQRVAADRFWMYDILFFDTPAAIRRWLERNRERTLAIALDHDLNRIEDETLPDDQVREIGTGAAAAEWLAEQTPFCPVVVHSTNQSGAATMVRLLEDAGWQVGAVVPSGDLEWIDAEWARTLKRGLAAAARAAVAERVPAPA